MQALLPSPTKSESPPAGFFGPPSTLTVPESVEVTELGLAVQVRDTLESRGVYDCSRLQTRKPEVYAIIVRLLSYGLVGKDEIAKLCGVAWETVAAVEAQAAPTIREIKTRFSSRLSLVISAALDGLLEKARRGKLSALDVAILLDKWALVSGEATARVEITEDPAVASFRQFMQSTAAPGMGFVGEPNSQRPDAWPAGEVPGKVIEVTPSDSPAPNHA